MSGHSDGFLEVGRESNCNLIVNYFEEKGKAGISTPILKGSPTKCMLHGGDTVKARIVVHHPPCCSALNLFQLFNILGSMGVPDC